MTTATIREIPKVGDGMTVVLWTDRYACTVESVSASGKTITLREDKATLLNGFNSDEPDALVSEPGGFAHVVSGTQRYSYAPDPEGRIWKATWREGPEKYKLVGSRNREAGSWVREGRSRYHDYGF